MITYRLEDPARRSGAFPAIMVVQTLGPDQQGVTHVTKSGSVQLGSILCATVSDLIERCIHQILDE